MQTDCNVNVCTYLVMSFI